MKNLLSSFLLITFTSSISSTVSADYFIKPYIGTSVMSSKTAVSKDLGTIDGKATIELDTGFVAGLGIGYMYDSNFSAELSWEYRTNDSQTRLADKQLFESGNYASNLFFLSSYYSFANNGNWQPFLGAGLSWAQEIDLDLEQNGKENSYSGNSKLGYQILAGVSYLFNNHIALENEIRYGKISNITLRGEGIEGELADIDYSPLTVQVGLRFKF